MERKFKHITGEICEYFNEDYYKSKNYDLIHKYFVELSSEWEEITEKDYEILSFKNTNTDNLVKLQNNNKYNIKNRGIYTLEECLGFKYLTIYSISRLSDNQVFTVGDDIIEQGEHSKIKSFKIIVNDLAIRIKHQVTKGLSTIFQFSKFEHYIPKKVLFTTKDGKKVFEGDKVYIVIVDDDNNISTNEEGKHFESQICSSEHGGTRYEFVQNRCFSTKEAAEDWIFKNKPCISYQDMWKVWENNKSKWSLMNEIEQLVKTKLKTN